ncbi:uncharacterized protein LOC125463357 [Stegostoma tigrinum]|uniref:uncharacterized protein LOC125463357 n=1 Tax=Stegostoma tigrinum TaxID=3053191 RepID=UPI00202B6CE1|nr:uncharacterized protein LOC125463357 [Stegostoma tigrinum]
MVMAANWTKDGGPTERRMRRRSRKTLPWQIQGRSLKQLKIFGLRTLLINSCRDTQENHQQTSLLSDFLIEGRSLNQLKTFNKHRLLPFSREWQELGVSEVGTGEVVGKVGGITHPLNSKITFTRACWVGEIVYFLLTLQSLHLTAGPRDKGRSDMSSFSLWQCEDLKILEENILDTARPVELLQQLLFLFQDKTSSMCFTLCNISILHL